MAVRSSSKSGRNRWDLFAEAIQGGWAATTRLAILLVLYSTPTCGAGFLAFRLIAAYLHHRLHTLVTGSVSGGRAGGGQPPASLRPVHHRELLLCAER
jgi:hypothetical protein